MSVRKEQLSDDIVLYCGDAREAAALASGVDLVATDPPYPNRAGHFLDGVEAAREFLSSFACARWLVFWDETEIPPVPAPLVAVHVWHRSNTNRPDNYEPIFVFNENGIKRASRVLSYPVVAVGLTGCFEATGHPTQKHSGLMAELLSRHSTAGETIFDPFMGSGTSGVAAVREGRGFIGCEIDPGHFEAARRRISNELSRPRLFAEPIAKPVQEAMSL